MAVKFRLLGEHEEMRVKWPVTVPVPADGGVVSQQMTAHFIILGADEIESIIAADPARQAQNVLEKAWTGWEGVDAPGGGEAAFSPEDRARMLNFYFVRLAVYQAYNDCLMGRAVKN